MKFATVLKLSIVCFICYAIYSAHNLSLKGLADKASMTFNSFRSAPNKAPEVQPNIVEGSDQKKLLPPPVITETLPLKASELKSSEPQGSIISNITSNIVNSILNNPNGRIMIEELINKNITSNAGFAENFDQVMAKEINPGQGAAQVKCGESVEVTYKINKLVPGLKDQIVQEPMKIEKFSIGENKLNRYIENGIIGMKKGGSRKIIFLEEDKITKENKLSSVDLTLVNFKPASIPKRLVKILIDKDTYLRANSKKKILCGDKVLSFYSIYDVQGKKLYSSKKDDKKLKFVVGDKSTSYMLSNAILSLPSSGSRLSMIGNYKDIKDIVGNITFPKNLSLSNSPIILEMQVSALD